MVVAATAARGSQTYLDHMLNMDQGARRLGEFAFGNNRNVDRCVRHILFDEKMARTVHQPRDTSPSHWRQRIGHPLGIMVRDLRQGSEIRVMMQLFCKDGTFAV